MTVPDPDHPWINAMRRQRRLMLIGVAVYLAVIAAVLFVLQRSVRTAAPLGSFLWLFGLFFLVACIVPLVGVSIMARKQRRWTESMLASGGMLCPRCSVPLEVQSEQTSITCSKCQRTFEREELRHFWSHVVHDPKNAGRWWVKNYGGRGLRGRMARWLFPDGRPHPYRSLLWNLAIWGGAGFAFALFTNSSLIVGTFTFLHMFLFMGGFILFTGGRKMRTGDSTHCAKCEYERGPESSAPAKCPECGFDWNSFGGTVTGRHEPRPAMMAAGVVMALVGILLLGVPFFASGWQFKLLPTGPLIHQAVSKGGFTIDEWAELRTRTLTPDQKRWLATGILDNRSYFRTDEDNWFVAEITAGTLPEDLKQRYYREKLTVNLIAPKRAKVGESVVLDLDCTFRGAATNNPTAALLFAGYFIDEDPTPIGRAESGIPGIMLDKASRGKSEPATKTAFTPQAIGAVKVRACMWVITMPVPGGFEQIQWQADGSPVIPANSVWHEMRELETAIVVE